MCFINVACLQEVSSDGNRGFNATLTIDGAVFTGSGPSKRLASNVVAAEACKSLYPDVKFLPPG